MTYKGFLQVSLWNTLHMPRQLTLTALVITTADVIYMSRKVRNVPLTCATNEDSNQPAHPRNLISLRCPHEGTSHPWLSKMFPVKILIRLRIRAGWSEPCWTHMSEGTFSDVAAHICLDKKRGLGLLGWYITKTCRFKYIENFTTQNCKFSDKKKSDIFHISAHNIDCGYSLEPPRRGGSNEYPQPMFLSRNKKNSVYPCKPQFYHIKVGFKGGQNYIGMFSWCSGQSY